MDSFLVTCEHGGNRIPAPCRWLFRGQRVLLDSHRGHDPARQGEAELCARWKATLAAIAPQLRVRRNYPYAGKGDGLTRDLRLRYPPRAYIGIELEVNQRIVLAAGRRCAALRGTLIASFRAACAGAERAMGNAGPRAVPWAPIPLRAAPAVRDPGSR